MPIPFRGGKSLTTTELAGTLARKGKGKKGKRVRNKWALANWIKYHGKGVLRHGEPGR